MTLAEIIKKYRIENSLSMDELAKRAGLSKPYISMLEKNKNSKNGKPIIPSIRTYYKLATAMNIPFENFLKLIDGDENISLEPSTFDPSTLINYVPIAKKKIPLLGEIAAGQPIYADEHIEEFLPVDDKLHADFALKIKGDSMINAQINDGDIVFIRQQSDVYDGQIAAVLINDSATLKRIYHMNGFLQLNAENPAYKPIICSPETCDTCRILGLAVAVLGKIKY